MPRFASLTFTALMILMPPPEHLASAQRAIPEDNLAYPVLLTIGNTAGSGFYISTNSNVYLVTAKHVIFDPAQRLIDTHLTLLSYSKDPTDATRNLVSADLTTLKDNGDIKPHPSEDVAVIKLFSLKPSEDPKNEYMIIPEPGVTVNQSAKQGVLGAKSDIVRLFADVIVGNDVMVFGYPSSLGLEQLPQVDIHRPLLRKGIVAGTNPEKRAIIIDCPSYFGNSGGPVVELEPVMNLG